MGKWIAGLLALTALSPVTASAQEMEAQAEGGWRGGPRFGAGIEANGDARAERRERTAPSEQPRGPERAPDRGPRSDGPRGDRGGPDGRPDGAPAFDRGDRGTDGERADRGDWRRRPGEFGGDRPAPVRPGPDRSDGNRFGQRSPDGPRVEPRQGLGRPIDRGTDRGNPGWQRSDDDRRGGGWQRGRSPDRRQGRDDDWTRSRFDDRGAWNGGIGIGIGGRGGWDRGWRDDRRYDWNRYRVANRNAFRLPRYYAPYGWSGGYRRFSIGAGLSASLWSRGYWIADPYAYRLPEPYGPYRWVRYYDDALLIDVRTGVIVDAAYGIFW